MQLSGASLSLGGDNTTTTYSGTLSGTGGLTKTGTGTLTLAGANAYSGDTAVRGGGVAVNGSLTDSDVYVYDQATLSGGGTITKTVHVLSGGTIAGSVGSGLTMGALDMQAGATMSVSLGAPSGSGVFNINGNVNLAGTLAVNPNPGFGFGIYRIANYGGTLTDNGMTVSGLPSNLEGGLQTAIPGQVNLYVDDPNNPTEFWNGSHTTPTQAVLGGSGTWTAGAADQLDQRQRHGVEGLEQRLRRLPRQSGHGDRGRYRRGGLGCRHAVRDQRLRRHRRLHHADGRGLDPRRRRHAGRGRRHGDDRLRRDGQRPGSRRAITARWC